MQESILTDIDQDVKERINYLVYKNRLRKEPITMQDLAVAYKYAKMNITVMEESKTSVLELLLLERYHDRICDMKIVELQNTLCHDGKRTLTQKKKQYAVRHTLSLA